MCVAVLASACQDGGGGGAAGGWEDRLGLLPATADAEEQVFVQMGDLATAAELAGVEWPPADGELVDTVAQLAGVGGSPVAIPLPSFIQVAGPAALEDLPEGVGWGLGDVDWLVSQSIPPRETTLAGGRFDAGAISEVLGEGPPWRIGDGEDLDPQVGGGGNALDRLGRAVTMTLVDDVLGFSTVTGGIDALNGEGDTLAGVEPLRRMAATADDLGCYAVAIYFADGVAQMVCTLPEVGEGPQFMIAGLGLDDPAAEAERIAGVDAGDRVDSVTTTVDDDMLLVTVDAADDTPGSYPQSLLARFDPLVPGFS